jgi:hypothetical protein
LKFTIKRNDTLPRLRATLTINGAPVNFSSGEFAGATVRFHMVDAFTNAVIVNAPASIVDAANGVVEYTWTAADTAVAGQYNAEFQVTQTSGKIMTFPNDGYIQIQIIPDLA